VDIQIQAFRDLVNQHVDVTVKAGTGELIASVSTTLDGFVLANDNLSPPENMYQRSWSQVGGGGPNQTHVVVVTVIDPDGNQSIGSKTWQD